MRIIELKVGHGCYPVAGFLCLKRTSRGTVLLLENNQ